tara:strand:+ start:422 stop:859 length:438 start_codon:yes stop_codon:yes gene_type:complete
MAKLLFQKDTPIDFNTFIKAIKVDGDADGTCAIHTCQTVDISDADYEGFCDGSKFLAIESNVASFVDATEDTTQVDKEIFTYSYNTFKEKLEFDISMKPSHSKITEVQACLSFLNTIDVDNLSYPTDNLDKKLKDNNKYIALSAF